MLEDEDFRFLSPLRYDRNDRGRSYVYDRNGCEAGTMYAIGVDTGKWYIDVPTYPGQVRM